VREPDRERAEREVIAAWQSKTAITTRGAAA
jgi:hypothetical protein